MQKLGTLNIISFFPLKTTFLKSPSTQVILAACNIIRAVSESTSQHSFRTSQSTLFFFLLSQNAFLSLINSSYGIAHLYEGICLIPSPIFFPSLFIIYINLIFTYLLSHSSKSSMSSSSEEETFS